MFQSIGGRYHSLVVTRAMCFFLSIHLAESFARRTRFALAQGDSDKAR